MNLELISKILCKDYSQSYLNQDENWNLTLENENQLLCKMLTEQSSKFTLQVESMFQSEKDL